jgi:hypothetical protein
VEQISCDCCGRWFWAQDENQLYCSACKTTRPPLRRWEVQTKTGDDIGKKIFDIVVAKRKHGVTVYDILKQLREKYGISKSGVTNILSSLDRTGYLIYMDNNKLFPYKDTHTGVVYE